MHPVTAAFYRLNLRYLRTETTGPLFEGMKAQLSGIASHTGMAGVFRLLGSDIYEVQGIDGFAGRTFARASRRGCGLLAGTAPHRPPGWPPAAPPMNCCRPCWPCSTTSSTSGHAMVLLRDGATERLYTVASAGYATSGVGSEIEMGHGVIGVAARECTPVRISHMTNAASYSHAVRSSMQLLEPGVALDTDIPYPGLPEPHSQLAVPIVSTGRLLGVLFVESPLEMRFGYEDEDALVAIAGAPRRRAGAAAHWRRRFRRRAATAAGRRYACVAPRETPPSPAAPDRGAPLPAPTAASSSATATSSRAWRAPSSASCCATTRSRAAAEFSNRELRLDPAIGLPDVADNLEARLVLLQRRLAENSPFIRIEKTGRGRFALRLERPVALAMGRLRLRLGQPHR